MSKFADCGHAYDGATDTGYCKGCERSLREQMYEEERRREEERAEEPHDD